MSRNVARYHQRLAREELSSPLGYHSWWRLGLGAFAVLAFGLSQLPEPRAWFTILAGLAIGLVAFGLRKHAEWTRWSSAALLGVGAVGILRIHGPSLLQDPLQLEVLKALMCAASALYLVLPSTGRLFRIARGELGPESGD